MNARVKQFLIGAMMFLISVILIFIAAAEAGADRDATGAICLMGFSLYAMLTKTRLL